MAAIKVRASDSQESILSHPTAEISTLNRTPDVVHLKTLYDEYEVLRKYLYGMQFIQVKDEAHQRELQKQFDATEGQMKELQQQILNLKKTGTFTCQNGVMLFEIAVVSILEFYGVEWSDRQIEEAAQELYQNYNWLQMAELKLFVAYVKNGVYGRKDFRKLAPFLLLQWVDEFATNSLGIREQKAIIKANEERYNERWATDDLRKASDDFNEDVKREANYLKSRYKSQDDAPK
jgi:hypothetical protein